MKDLYKKNHIFYRKVYKIQKLSNINNSLYAYFTRYLYFQRNKVKNFNQFFIKYFLTNNTIENNKKIIIADILNKLNKTFMVSGYKLKSYTNIHYSFFKLYSMLNIETLGFVSKNYVYFKEFLFNNVLDRNLNSAYSIINWLFFWYQPMFYVKCSLVPKKYRKKLKKKYVYSASYVDVSKRKNIALRWVLFFLNTFNSYKTKNRLFLLFSDLIFNFKNSIVYSRKIKMYKKVFKI